MLPVPKQKTDWYSELAEPALTDVHACNRHTHSIRLTKINACQCLSHYCDVRISCMIRVSRCSEINPSFALKSVPFNSIDNVSFPFLWFTTHQWVQAASCEKDHKSLGPFKSWFKSKNVWNLKMRTCIFSFLGGLAFCSPPVVFRLFSSFTLKEKHPASLTPAKQQTQSPSEPPPQPGGGV